MKTALAIGLLAMEIALPRAAEAHAPLFSLTSSDSSPPSWDGPRALVVLPILRAEVGGAFLPVAQSVSHFVFGAYGGALIGWPGKGFDLLGRGSIWLRPEVGYSLSRNPAGPDTHLGSLGMGVGYGNLLAAAVAYTPRLVVGQTGDDLTIGFRHGISGHFLLNWISIELSHQILSTAGALSHEILLTVGLNPGGLLFYAIYP